MSEMTEKPVLSSAFQPFLITNALTALILFLASIFFVAKLAVSVGKRKVKSGFHSIPGPSRLPLIGCAHKVPPIREFRNSVKQFTQKYGSIWRFRIFHEDFVFLANAPDVQRILTSNQVGHLKRSSRAHEIVFGKFVTGGLFRSNDISGEWSAHRKILKGAFSFKSLQSYVPLITKYSKELTSDLRTMFDCEKGTQFQPIEEQLDSCGIKLISEAVFGLNASERSGDVDALCKNLKKTKLMVLERVSRPLLLIDFIWRLDPLSRQFDRAYETVHLLLKGMIEENDRKGVADDNTAPNIKTMMELMKEEGFNEHEILEEVKTLIVAGFETTSTLEQFTLLMLALNPEQQTLCRQEIDSIFTSPSLSPEGNLTFEGLQEMKYTERCLMETLRLFPPAHTMPRTLETPLLLDNGLEIPVGVTVTVYTELVHRNPEYYPQPDLFDPERFLPENCAKRHPYAFIPFGSGKRICIGWKFGMMAAKSAVGHILRNFEVYTSDTLEGVPIIPSLVLAPERGYLFHLKQRDLTRTL